MNSLDDARHVGLPVEPRRELEAVGQRGLDEILGMQALVAGAQSALEEQLLPLLDHAVAEVVEHHDLDRQVVGRDGLELAEVHADAGVAVDVDDQAVALGELRADRRRQAESHGAHAAGGQPQPRAAEIEILRRPHLVLADAGGDDRLAAGQPVDLLDHVVRLDQLAVAVVVHRILARAARRSARCHADQSRWKPLRLAVIEQRSSASGIRPTWLQSTRLTLLISEASISKCAMNLALRGELRRIAGDAVVEARAEREQAIAVIDRIVGECRAVHAEHAHRQRIGGVDGADAHQRGDHRDPEVPGKFAQRSAALGVDHAAAGIDQRPLRGRRARRKNPRRRPRGSLFASSRFMRWR